MPFIVFVLFFALASESYAQTDSLPVPFEPLDTNNAVSEELYKLYGEDPLNSSIPADILAILQNKENLEPPTIVRKATSEVSPIVSYNAPDPFEHAAPVTEKKRTFGGQRLTLFQSLSKSSENRLTLTPAQNKSLSIRQKTDSPLIDSAMGFEGFPQIFPDRTNSLYTGGFSGLNNMQMIAAGKQVSDISGNGPEESLTRKDIEKTKKPQFSATDEALTSIKLEELEEKVRKNDDEEAKILLARAYFNGTAGHKDIDRAFKLMEENAKRGSTKAMIELGRMYEADSPRYNIMRSANYYRQAADYGNIEGKYCLGLLYYRGKFGQGDDALKHAIYAFREAAGKGHAPSMFELATMYEKGVGFAKDMGQAVQLYRKSAHLGYAPSQLQVGLLYENGILVPKNETLAAAWYVRAAEQSHPTAQYLLAGMYRQGIGVPKNLEQAKILYENAANFGLVDAQYDLGVFYLLKTEYQNYRKAEYWLQKAADQNDTQAREILIQLQQKLSKSNTR